MDEDEKRSLRAELRNLTERERQALKDHPTPEELVAYRDGDLSGAEEERLRDHLAVCRDCAALLLDLADFGNLKPAAGVPELTDAQVDQAWQDLRSRIAKEETPELSKVVPLIRPVPPAQPARVEAPARSYAGWAIAASLVAVVSLFWGFQQRERARVLSRPALIELAYPELAVRGGVRMELPSHSKTVLRMPPILGDEPDSYVVELVEENESPLLAEEAETLDALALSLPEGLPRGNYQLLIYGVEGGKREVIEQFAIAVDDPQ